MWTGLMAGLFLLSIYSYFIYPVLLLILRLFRRRGIARSPIEPRVSLIITAYNEENKIEGKLRNSREVEYPSAQLEIIVASDSSTDRTDAIVSATPDVKLVRADVRKGKEYAQKLAVQQATGEILVFTDTGTMLDKEAIRLLVRNFADPSVGAVSSTDKLVNENNEIVGEGLYVKYEMLLRRLEHQVNSLVGLSGSFFAARSEVCRDWADDLQSDFNTVLNSIKKGYRAVADDDVIGYYKNIKKGQSEFHRKVRTMVRGITVFFRTLDLLNPFRYGLFAWQLFSHKLMRWLVPFFLLALLAVSLAAAAAGDPNGRVFLALQAASYLAVIAAGVWPGLQRIPPIKIAYFFIEANLAAAFAWVKYLRGERIKLWEPSKR
jgi:cellulose synthase/poly-beta-1,6-N-acetylglucosamine synthase-like glycosyltransferase